MYLQSYNSVGLRITSLILSAVQETGNIKQKNYKTYETKV